MAGATTVYAFALPTVGGDADLWGGFLNQNWNDLDALLAGTGELDGVKIINGDLQATLLAADEVTILAGTGTLEELTVVDKLQLAGIVDEGIQTKTGTSPTIGPSGGGPINEWTPGNSSNSPGVTLDPGEYVTLIIHMGTGTISWSGVTWIGGTPSLISATTNICEFFRVGATTFGMYAGAI
jgi:hypothetical protein